MAQLHYHITFVGGQPDPVVQGILLSRPDYIFYVYSDETPEQLQTVKKRVTEKITRDIPYGEYKCTTYDNDELLRVFSEILNMVKPEHKISINMSGGAKSWNIIMLKLYLKNRDYTNNNDQVYFIHQNGDVMPIYGTVEQKYVDFDFEYVKNQFKNITPYAEFSDDERELAQTVNQLYDYGLVTLLQNFINNLLDGKVDNFDKNSSYRYQGLSWSARSQEFTLTTGKEEYIFKGKHAVQMLLNTGWFEYLIASQLAEIYGADKVFCNCEVIRNGKKINEVDIVVNAGNKAIFVECKTQIYNPTDLDKFNSVCRAYGGLSAKRLFITRRKMSEDIINKCKEYNIYTYIASKKVNQQWQEKTPDDLKKFIDSFINTSNR